MRDRREGRRGAQWRSAIVHPGSTAISPSAERERETDRGGKRRGGSQTEQRIEVEELPAVTELIERKSWSEEKHVFQGVDGWKARERKERTNDRTVCSCLNINVLLMWIWSPALVESPWTINFALFKPKKELFYVCPFIKRTLREIE